MTLKRPTASHTSSQREAWQQSIPRGLTPGRARPVCSNACMSVRRPWRNCRHSSGSSAGKRRTRPCARARERERAARWIPQPARAGQEGFPVWTRARRIVPTVQITLRACGGRAGCVRIVGSAGREMRSRPSPSSSCPRPQSSNLEADSRGDPRREDGGENDQDKDGR